MSIKRQTERSLEQIAKTIDLIENDTIRNWSKKYLHGHVDHYNSILDGILLCEKVTISPLTRLLDIGGVPSHIDAYLKTEGYNIELLDIKPDRIKEFLDAFEIRSFQADIEQEKFPFEDDTFDLILFNEVLEHLRIDPLNPFKEIKRILKPNGFLVFSTPNITPQMRFKFLRGIDYIDDIVTEFEKIGRLGHMGHFRIYSLRELNRILNHFDFRVITQYYGGKYDVIRGSLSNRVFLKLFKERMRRQVFFVCKNEK